MSNHISAKIRRRQVFRNWWIPPILIDPLRRCPHETQWGIYGDEILATMNWRGHIKRARCLDCGRLLPDLPT
jgi:hypothetical protein